MALPTQAEPRTAQVLSNTDILQKRIAVVGLGFVGMPLAGVFADTGFRVTGVDVQERVLKIKRDGRCHFEEKDVEELVNRYLGERLAIEDHLAAGEHDVYIIAVGTPIDSATKKPVLDYVKNAAEAVGRCLKKGDLVILRSTVPVGTTRRLVLPILEKASGLAGGTDFDIVFAPERVLSGKLLKEIREVPQILGALTEDSDIRLATELFGKMTPTVIPVGRLEAAEMGKLMDNTYRDLTFAYANQMARMSENVGVDIHVLVKALNQGYPRNNIPLPSPGVGGSCLTKDPYLLMEAGREYGYDAELTRAAREVNEAMPSHVADTVLGMLRKAGKDPAASTVLVLGFAFKGKPETTDTRDASTTPVVQALQDAGCVILGHDPVVPTEKIQALHAEPVEIADGFTRADAVVVMTNHPAYAALDPKQFIPTMRPPAVLYDGWRLFDPATVRAAGAVYASVGVTYESLKS